jgi:glycosyltransferase involved in cell wall biosynthesis
MIDRIPSRPFVSICVPTYNGGKFLRECLASVQAQTLQDFEVIIVDDDSQDDSVVIAQEFARNDARFRVQRNPQRLGLVGNLNHSLELSRGTWIKFLFQDDALEPECLKALTEGCERQQCGFGFCRRNFLFADDVAPEVREYFTRHQALIEKNFNGRLEPLAFARLCADTPEINLLGEPTAVIFHRSILEKFGGFKPLLIQLCDSEYWMRIGSNVGVAHVPERLATFRVHGRSATMENFSRRKYRSDYLDPLIIRYLILRDGNFKNIRRMLYRQRGHLSVWWRFIQHAHHARAIARAKPGTMVDGTQEMKEWNEVARALPGLRSLAVAGVVVVPLQHFLSRCGLSRLLNRFRHSETSARQQLPQEKI